MMTQYIYQPQSVLLNSEDEFSLKEAFLSHGNDYFEWGKKKFSLKYIKTLKNRLEGLFEHSYCTRPKEVLRCIEINRLEPQYTTKAVRNFLNYLDERELIPEKNLLAFRNKIKIHPCIGLDTFVPNVEQIERSGKLLYGSDLLIYRLLIESGCRFTELEHFIDNFDEDKVEVHGNVVTYRNFYRRGNKSSFYLFFTKKTFDSFMEHKITMRDLGLFLIHVKKNDHVISSKYLRKFQFTQLVKGGVPIEIANFIQGRCSQDIGFNHYLGKKEIAVKEYQRLIA